MVFDVFTAKDIKACKMNAYILSDRNGEVRENLNLCKQSLCICISINNKFLRTKTKQKSFSLDIEDTTINERLRDFVSFF